MSDVTLQFGYQGEPTRDQYPVEHEVGDVIHVGPYEYLRISGKTTSREELITGIAGMIRDEGREEVMDLINEEVERQLEVIG